MSWSSCPRLSLPCSAPPSNPWQHLGVAALTDCIPCVSWSGHSPCKEQFWGWTTSGTGSLQLIWEKNLHLLNSSDLKTSFHGGVQSKQTLPTLLLCKGNFFVIYWEIRTPNTWKMPSAAFQIKKSFLSCSQMNFLCITSVCLFLYYINSKTHLWEINHLLSISAMWISAATQINCIWCPKNWV